MPVGFHFHVLSRSTALVLLLLTIAVFPQPWASAASPPDAPPASAADVARLLDRLVARAHAVAQDTNLPVCRYRKRTLSQSLGSDGSVKQTKEKIYDVTMLRGMTHNRLLSVNGRDLSAEESLALSEKERRWRETYAASRNDPKSGSGAERMDNVINEQLIARFHFQWVGRERLHDRDCAILEFKPRPGPLPEDRLLDRILNLFQGRVWIDLAEDEIVRAEARTVGSLRVWGGLLGSLESFEMRIDRERSPVGVWFNRYAEISLRARKLFTSFGMFVREISNDLRPVETP